MSHVHDNDIKSYTVDLENNEIIFDTVYFDKENTSIEFINVMGHLFKNIDVSNMIFDIEHYGLDDFIKDNSELLEKTRNYGWPLSFDYRNIDILKEILNKNKQKYYVINACLGLDG